MGRGASGGGVRQRRGRTEEARWGLAASAERRGGGRRRGARGRRGGPPAVAVITAPPAAPGLCTGRLLTLAPRPGPLRHGVMEGGGEPAGVKGLGAAPAHAHAHARPRAPCGAVARREVGTVAAAVGPGRGGGVSGAPLRVGTEGTGRSGEGGAQGEVAGGSGMTATTPLAGQEQAGAGVVRGTATTPDQLPLPKATRTPLSALSWSLWPVSSRGMGMVVGPRGGWGWPK